jgi:PIN domain nuclease of toxin-antitoxin system
VRLLLDTHVVLWWLSGDRRLSRPVRSSIERQADQVLVSAASAWELAIKRAVGKLEPPVRWPQEIIEVGFEPLAITLDHAREAGELPRHHADPFDRMLVAQARLEALTLVSADPNIARYDVAVLRP